MVYDIIHCKERYEILRRFEREIMLVAIIKLFSTTIFSFLNHKAILKLDGGSILRRIYSNLLKIILNEVKNFFIDRKARLD